MDRAHRLTSSRDFARAVQAGRRGTCGPVGVAVLATLEERPPRVGFSSGRAGPGAVGRNRAKRRLREATHRAIGVLPAGLDVVVHARAPIERLSLADLERALRAALAEAGVAC